MYEAEKQAAKIVIEESKHTCTSWTKTGFSADTNNSGEVVISSIWECNDGDGHILIAGLDSDPNQR